MSRAKDSMMDELHLITAETLKDIIRNGVEVLDKEGNAVRQPAPAAYIAAAIKFLKDNGITAEINSGRLKDMNDALKDVPTFDDDAEFDHQHMN